MQIFSTNDVSKAEEICDPNIKVHNLLVSDETVGLDAWKDSLKNIFKGEAHGKFEASSLGLR